MVGIDAELTGSASYCVPTNAWSMVPHYATNFTQIFTFTLKIL